MAYKLKIQAIYQIRNTVNNKFYIGSSNHFLSRKITHLSALRKNEHYNRQLQFSWNKYGEENFVFEILEEVTKLNQLLVREQHYLDTLKPTYNVNQQSNSTVGYKHSPEAILKISNAAKKPIIQYDRKLNIIKEWESIREASGALNIHETHISECCNGEARSAKGFVFKFKDNFIPYKHEPTKTRQEIGRESAIKKTYQITYNDGKTKIIYNLAEYCENNNIKRGTFQGYIGKDTMTRLGFVLTKVNEI